MSLKHIALIFIVVLFAYNMYSQNISIVVNNIPSANIVVRDKSNKQLNKVAEELQNCIFKSAKTRLSIVNYVHSRNNNIIIETQFRGINYNYKQLDDDGFVIKTSGNNIIISGKTDWGTEFGVYEFLERFLGIRWLMPTELWTEIPSKTNIILGKINIEENPKFLSRSFFNVNMQNKDVLLKEWGKKNRLKNRVAFHHNLKNLFKADIIVKDYPHFLPTVGNKRYLPPNNIDERWNPNFMARGIENYAANEIIKYFKQNPNENSYSLGVNDTDNFDQSNTDSSKNYFGLDNYSNAYYTWVNKTVKIVNRTFPNKKFGLLAYSQVAEPPSFKLEDNVIPFITYERIMWLEPTLKRKDIVISRKWQHLTNEYGWYDYVYGLWYLVPRVYFKHYQDYLKIAYDLNVKYYVAEYYPNWLEGPKGWVMTKLLWSPDQNLDALLDDWYINAVGVNSAKYLKQFYDLWENVWTQKIPNSKWWSIKGGNGTYLRFNNQEYFKEISYDTILHADELLKLAYKNTATKIQKERVESLIEMWEFCKMNYLYFRQKYTSDPNISIWENKLINSKKVTKREINKKISELERHPLYNDIAQRYSSWVWY